MFQELMSFYISFAKIYSDRWKEGSRVYLVACPEVICLSTQLLDGASLYTAELTRLQLALDLVREKEESVHDIL